MDTILVGFPILNEMSDDSVSNFNEIRKLVQDGNTADVVALLMASEYTFVI